MKKSLKMFVCIAIAVIMTASLLVGCGGKKPVLNNKSKPAEKLSILTYGQADYSYNQKMPVLAELEKRLNLKIDWQNLPVGQEQQKFDLIFASGKLPDIVLYSDIDQINKLGSEGALIPLEKLIDKDGPDIKKSFDKLNNEISHFKQRVYSTDGHMYNIPSIIAKDSSAAMTWAIREDWCKNVGKNVPKTTDELYEVLKAFKNGDPNKDGKKDKLPLVSRNDDYYLLFLANSWGVQRGFFFDDKANEVKLGYIDPRFKEALEYIHRLYAEGLIDPEYITNTDDQFYSKIVDSRAGMFLGYANSQIGAAHDALKSSNSNYNLVSMLPVTGPHGDCMKQDAYTRLQYRGSITKSCKNPDTAMRLFNYCFSKEGHDLLTWGIEGKTYLRNGDKKQITDYVSRNPNGLDEQTVIDNYGIDPSLPHEYDDDAYFAQSQPFVKTIFELYASKPGVLKEEFSCNLNKDETDKMSTFADLWKYANPMISKFITGKESFDNWDKFVAQCNQMHAQEALQIYNTAYKRQYGIK